jgi:DNA uptake protein ComE-like DNA-binding protein
MKRYQLLVASILAVVALMIGAPAGVAQTKKPATTTKSATTAKAAVLDINSASKAELAGLTGIGDVYSQKIIDGRPYTRKDQLVSKKIVPQATYDKIKDQIVATQAKKK